MNAEPALAHTTDLGPAAGGGGLGGAEVPDGPEAVGDVDASAAGSAAAAGRPELGGADGELRASEDDDRTAEGGAESPATGRPAADEDEGRASAGGQPGSEAKGDEDGTPARGQFRTEADGDRTRTEADGDRASSGADGATAEVATALGAAAETEAEDAAEGKGDGKDAGEGGGDGENVGADEEGGEADKTDAKAPATDSDSDSGPQLSEAEAELAAQRELRARIEQRKAQKQGAVAAGAALSGKAADLLAAVRAVESGERPAGSVFTETPEPPRRRPAPAPRPARPAAARPPAGPSAGLLAAVGAVLSEGGAPASLAAPVALALGQGADRQLRANPWQLLRVQGVRPEQADGFARAVLGPDCSPGDERRGRSLAVWLLEQAALAGHTALAADKLTGALGQRAVPEPETCVQSAIAEGEILVFQDAPDSGPGQAADLEEGQQPPVQVLFGLERCAMAEESVADGVARLTGSPVDESSAEVWQGAAAGLSGSAAELARAVAGHALVLHTGGEAALAEPAALLARARAAGLRACAAAHTPYGARRFASLATSAAGPEAHARSAGTPETGASETGASETGASETGAHGEWATTVGALLGGSGGPGRDAEGALALDLLVVLDAPQLDVETAALLFEALPDGARLVLCGDPAALWSAGPGRVFADLLAARRCPQIASRTPDPGPLGELVSGIGAGELLQVEAPGKEVVIVPVREPGEAVHRTVQLVADSVPRTFSVAAGETQVIVPGRGGAAGSQALNAALKERLNPGPGRFGGFDPGDRVAYTTAPGHVVFGTVVRADAEGLHLDCESGPVAVAKDRVPQAVRHGWAVTTHEAVGRRWPTAVVVLPGDAADTLTRAWVYTAFGRAERHLSVVHGVDRALPAAVAERPAKPRTTRLITLLRPTGEISA